MDRPSFAEVFAAELPYVLRSLRRLGASAPDAEDLGHDVFIIVHRELPSFEAKRPLRPWLFGIAFRVASDHRRLARNRLEVPTAQLPDLERLHTERLANKLVGTRDVSVGLQLLGRGHARVAARLAHEAHGAARLTARENGAPRRKRCGSPKHARA